MKDKYKQIIESSQIQNVMKALHLGQNINLSNVKSGLKGFLALAMWQGIEGNLLYIAPTEREAQKQQEMLQKLIGKEVLYYPLDPIHS